MKDENVISRFFRRVEVAVFYHPKTFLTCMLLVTLFFASRLPYLQMYSNFADLLPQEHPYIQLHNEIRDTFGGANNVVMAVMVEEGDIFTNDTLAKIHRLTQGVDSLPGVNHNLVSSLTHRTVRKTWLTELVETNSDIGPALRADGTVLFWRQQAPSFDQALMSMDADGSNVESLVDNGTNPVTSPDGTEVLYRDSWRHLMLGDSSDPAAATMIIDGGDDFILDYDFSPDLSQVAYTRGREDASCSDLWVADIDAGLDDRDKTMSHMGYMDG